ncbi:MAG: hypothetical protein ACR2L2_06390 [Acidobacteriota bacterium]
MPDRTRKLKHASVATTRNTKPVRVPLHRARNLLEPEQVITSPETQLQYGIERFLGEGGFGQVYLVRRLGRSSVVPETLCIKVSTRIDGWNARRTSGNCWMDTRGQFAYSTRFR